MIGSAKYYPRTFSNKLRSSLQMIFMDHRGFGEMTSPVTEQSFELTKIINDIEKLRKALKLDKIIVIGHSIHAFMAMEYAKKYPKYIQALVLIAASPIAGAKLYEAADRYFQESVCPKRKALLASNLSTLDAEIAANPDAAFVTRMMKFGPMIWYDFAYDASKLWEGVTLNPEGAAIIWGSMFAEYDIEQGLDDLGCPVFLALGRYDYWNPPHLWENVRFKFNDITIRVFEKSGHTPQLEEYEHFDAELLAFLKGHVS